MSQHYYFVGPTPTDFQTSLRHWEIERDFTWVERQLELSVKNYRDTYHTVLKEFHENQPIKQTLKLSKHEPLKKCNKSLYYKTVPCVKGYMTYVSAALGKILLAISRKKLQGSLNWVHKILLVSVYLLQVWLHFLEITRKGVFFFSTALEVC